MTRASRKGAALALCLALAGCHAAAPPPPPRTVAAAPRVPPPPPPLPAVTLRPADAVRDRALLIARQAPLDRIDAAAAPLAARVGAAWDLSGWLLGDLSRAATQAAVPGAVWARADRRRGAVAVALVSGFKLTACAAIPFPDDASARTALEAVGPEASRHEGVSTRTLPDGSKVWAAWGSSVLFLSGQEGGIESAGALALEEMARVSADAAAPAVWVELRPQAFGPGLPALLKLGIAAALRDGQDKKAKAGGPPEKTAAGREMATAMADGVGQVSAVRATLQIDPALGLAVHVTVVPLAGGVLAATLVGAAPYAIDPRLPVSEPSTALAAFGTKGPVLDGMSWVAEHGGPAGRGFGVALAALRAQTRGAVSCAMRLHTPLDVGCVWGLAGGVRAARILDLYAGFLRSSSAWNVAMSGAAVPPPRVERRGAVVEIEERLAADPRLASETRRQLLGGDTRRTAATVSGGALVTAQGPQPRALLAALTGAPAAVPPALLAAALQRTAGAHAFLFLDLPSAVVKVTDGSADPSLRQVHRMLLAVPGVSELRAPLILALRADGALDLEIALQAESLENIGRVLRPFMGVMGAAPR